jgi:xylan 1,4-beta-xylosidase
MPASAATLPPLKHAWKGCICQGTASEILRADVQQHLRYLQKEIGYRSIRFHATFHDDMGVVERAADGSLVFNWALVDKVYDFLVELGFEPIVEFNPMPACMASGEKTFFHYKMNITPPRLMAEWEQLVAAAARHFIERHGLARVRRWKFEVWNEPNLNNQFWSGTQEEYFELYAASARALKSVHPDLQVGGPASAGGEMVHAFAAWCRERAVPMDFFSYHFYPMAEYGVWKWREGSPAAPGRFFADEFRKTRAALAEAGFGHLPHIITEWNVLHCGPHGKAKWVGCDDVVRLFGCAAVIHHALHADPHVEVLGYWTASDVMHEAGLTRRRYDERNQHYGILDIAGEPKPAFHAFSFLNRLQGPRHDISLPDRPALADCLVTDETVCTRALLWNFHLPEMPAQTWTGRLALPLPPALASAKRVRLATALVTAGAGSAYETWLALGRPASLSRIDGEALRAAAWPRQSSRYVEVVDGHATLEFALARDEVLFVETLPVEPGLAMETPAELAALNHALEYPGAL